MENPSTTATALGSSSYLSNRYYYDFLVVFFMEANTVFVAMVFFTRFYSDLVAMFLGFTSFFISS